MGSNVVIGLTMIPKSPTMTVASNVASDNGDHGIDKHGQRKPTYAPGPDIRAAVTILCDGVRGNLTKTLVQKLRLDEGRLPQLYALGIKELWELPDDRVSAGSVVHTMGYPLRMEEFGGGFIYGLPDGLVSVGFVSGLDYRDPMFDPHVTFQHFKRHPLVASRLRDESVARRRLVHGAARVCRWPADRGRRGRIREFDAPEGDSPGDANRDAGGGIRVRGDSRR